MNVSLAEQPLFLLGEGDEDRIAHQRDIAEAREMLADCARILSSIARSLIARQSRYAAVPQALLVIAGEKPVDAAEVKPVREPADALDRDWAERPAFADAGPSGGGSTIR